MPVQTRAAKLQAEQPTPPPLRSESTITTISPSATGKGKPSRWSRPSKQSAASGSERGLEVDADPRFTTPSPLNENKLTTPPKVERRPHHSNPLSSVESIHPRSQSEESGAETEIRGRILYDELRRPAHPISPSPATEDDLDVQGLGSPFGRRSRSFQSFSEQSIGEIPRPHLQPSEGPGPQTEMAHPQSTPYQTRGLGRHGTVLLGPDGQAVRPPYEKRSD
ncbi:hypothetical protein GALMADRAFT_758137 [Galerina marginata CBS 339.88]|uniref:Uncharacterized protein n=1 Tax=Galerina marginata (strain CBS 339.88) TaxID=685588 RepID=A0A067SP06_GALM3|nr:hypothetical protein GALMADRAFT_758137 [Galerina marginata CBS 339.88]